MPATNSQLKMASDFFFVIFLSIGHYFGLVDILVKAMGYFTWKGYSAGRLRIPEVRVLRPPAPGQKMIVKSYPS